MLGKNFQIYGVKITVKYICEQKIECIHFYSCANQNSPPKILITTPETRGN